MTNSRHPHTSRAASTRPPQPRHARGLEAIATAPLGENQARVVRVALELLSQVADVDAQVRAGLRVVPAPHLADQAVVGHDLPGVAGEHGEQSELRRGQVYQPALPAHLVTFEGD